MVEPSGIPANDPILQGIANSITAAEKAAAPPVTVSEIPDLGKDPLKETEVINNLLDAATGKLSEAAIPAGVEPAAVIATPAVEITPAVAAPSTDLDAILNASLPPASPQEEELTSLRQMASEYQEYKDFLQDPLMTAFMEYRKNGGANYREFLNNTLGQDISHFSDEHKYKMYLKGEGMTLDAAIQEQWETFEAQTEGYKAIEMRKINEHFERQAGEKVSKYGLSLKESRNTLNQELKTAQEQGYHALSGAINKITGVKLWDTLAITPEIAKVLSDTVTKEINSLNFYEHGKGVDVNRALRMAVWEKYGQQVIDTLKTNTKHATTHEVLQTTVNPVKNTAVENLSIPQANDGTEMQKSLDKLIAGKF